MNTRGRQQIVKMLLRSRADDSAGYSRLVKNPGQRQLGQGAAFMPGSGGQLLSHFNSLRGDALGVDWLKGPAAVGRQVCGILVAAGQHALVARPEDR